ncbi:MAG TPA: polysaccharide deacetylase family protein [Candidatus Limnocylindrales bacterium]
MPIPRRSLLTAATALLACGCAAKPTIEQGSAPTEPSRTPEAPPTAVSLDPPTAAPVASTGAPTQIKTISWYLSQVPKFPKAPKPERISLPRGDSTPWWHRVPTQHKVAFITIDDGGMSRTNDALQLIKRADIPVTMFLNSPAAASHTSYFEAIRATGAHAQDHTVTHRNLKGQTYDFQYQEIKDCADKLEQLFGERPWLFRPPFGNYDAVTLKAARDCGMRVSFMWAQTVNEGIVRYQTSKNIVKPGDVLLMHFRPALADDLIGALKAIHESGLTPARLEDYLPRAA